MRKFLFICLSLYFVQTQAYSQEKADDYILALKQQREEAQDKLVNAYVTIMKLQRELDRMKADQAHPDQPVHKAPDEPSK